MTEECIVCGGIGERLFPCTCDAPPTEVTNYRKLQETGARVVTLLALRDRARGALRDALNQASGWKGRARGVVLALEADIHGD